MLFLAILFLGGGALSTAFCDQDVRWERFGWVMTLLGIAFLMIGQYEFVGNGYTFHSETSDTTPFNFSIRA